MRIKCKECGSLKETEVPNAVFCGPACKKAYWKKRRRREREALELIRRAAEKMEEI